MFLLRPLLRPFLNYCALFELLRPFLSFTIKVRYLKSGVRFSHLTKKHNHTKIGTTVLLVALLATCTSPSYAEMGKSLFGSNSDFVQELNKISYLTPPKNRERDYLVTEPKIQPSDVKKSHFTLNSSLLKIQEVDYFFNQLKIQPIDTQSLINNPVRFL